MESSEERALVVTGSVGATGGRPGGRRFTKDITTKSAESSRAKPDEVAQEKKIKKRFRRGQMG